MLDYLFLGCGPTSVHASEVHRAVPLRLKTYQAIVNSRRGWREVTDKEGEKAGTNPAVTEQNWRQGYTLVECDTETER